MEIKLFELRDRATFIPVIAIRPGYGNASERYLWARSGYGRTNEEQSSYVILAKTDGATPHTLHYSPGIWGNRTMTSAHYFIRDNWDDLVSGQVIDVEFILGEKSTPKLSERLDDIFDVEA